MVKSKGPKRRTRNLLKRGVRERTPITRYLHEFKKGTKVLINPSPSSQKGMPFKRFFGKIGIVTDKRGNSFVIKIRDGNKEKEILSRPEHLRVV